MHKTFLLAKAVIAIAQAAIVASAGKVWDALISPEVMKQCLPVTTVVAGKRAGCKMLWKGDWLANPPKSGSGVNATGTLAIQ